MRGSHSLSCCIETLENRRLLSAGGLDLSFANGGNTLASFAPQRSSAHAVAVQSDGKIVEVGGASNNLLAMVRFKNNGALDTSFGSGGKVLYQYGINPGAEEGKAVAIQSDGKIVVAASSSDSTFDILRFNSNGSIDNSFGSGGFVSIDQGDQGLAGRGEPSAIAIQKDGKIVIAGDRIPSGIIAIPEFEVVRLNSNGSLDRSFGELPNSQSELRTGKTSFGLGGLDIAHGIAIDDNGDIDSNPDFGKIIVVGQSRATFSPTSRGVVVRLNSDGTLDKSFNGSGEVFFKTIGPSATASLDSAVIEAGGDIIASGVSNGGGILLGLTSSGASDINFGTSGRFATGIASVPIGGEAVSLINGFTQDLIAGGKGGIAAFTLDGKLDPNFGNGGVSTVAAGVVAMAASPGRTIVAITGGGGHFATARIFDTAPKVSVTAINSVASEQGPTPISFFVSRDLRLPFATRVFFTIGGTATAPSLFTSLHKTADYTLDGMTIPLTSQIGSNLTPFVDIPANETFTLVTLTPIDDTRVEGTELATFSANSDPLYDRGAPLTATISILDNDAAKAPVTVNATADAFVLDGSFANTNFGSSTTLKVKNGGAGSGLNRITFLKFDLSSISTVNSVQLNLFGELNSSAATNVVTQVFGVSDTTWSETKITFNNKPAIGATALANATIADTTPRLYSFDITAYVKAQLAAGHKIITLALKDPAVTSPFVSFNSREAGTNRPALVVS